MNKKDRILSAALELFAKEGFDAVSTSKIADVAGVSEGLVFKHFGSKQKLLESILYLGEKRISEIFNPVLEETQAKLVIRRAIEVVFNVKEEEHDFWRLQYQLKWRGNIDQNKKLEPILSKLEWAFRTLDFEQPKLEADLLVKTIDILAISILQEGIESQCKFENFLKLKYKV